MGEAHTPRLVTLLGAPLEHSFSARMQNAAFAAAGVKARFFNTEADVSQLEAALRAVRGRDEFAGCAVTSPDKVAVLRYLDALDPLCERIGACNTVVRGADGSLTGYNTDGFGALRSLEEALGTAAGKVFFCFGAGGTGRSVCFTLADAGAKRLYVCSRSDGCETLCAALERWYPGVAVPVRAADERAVARGVAAADAVLNLTGAGMRGREDETCVDGRRFRRGQLCFDATYNPAEPRFLREAREAGCETVNGLSMLLWQGARQFELWTGGIPAPLDAMRRALREALAERTKGDV